MSEENTNYQELFSEEADEVEAEKARTRNRISDRVVMLYIWATAFNGNQPRPFNYKQNTATTP